jgi:hypothetical protein
MQTGAISFCDRVHYNVKSSETKAALLQRLRERYQLRIIARHWQRFEARALSRGRWWLNVRSNGNPYYMVLTRHDGVESIVFVDKKVQPGYEYPRMILTKGRFDPVVFDDTVLDGEMVKASTGCWVFLVNDVVAFAGRAMGGRPLPERLARAAELFATRHEPDALMDTCVFQVKRYYSATQEGCTALLEAAADLPYTQRGIYAWPDAGGTPLLYNFDDALIQPIVRKVKDAPSFCAAADPVEAAPRSPDQASASALPSPAAPRPTDQGGRRLWLRKTENPDVYEVQAAAGAPAMGIAGVPSLAASKMLRAVFKNKTVAVSMPFECVFHEAFGKWVPVSASG